VETFIAGFAILMPYAHSVAVTIGCHINFSRCFRELLPKRIGLNHPEAIAKAFAMPMKMVSVVTAPFIWLLTKYRVLLDILKIRPSSDGKITEEEIKAIIKQGTETGEVQEIEQDIVERVFTLEIEK
jgi:putative hemolysin